MTACAGRKVRRDKLKAETAKRESVDSSTVDKTKTTKTEETTSSVKTQTTESLIAWKYTAPTMSFPAFNPIWLKIGSDSVDLSKLPPGSSLESNNETRSKSTDSLGMLKKKDEEIKDLKNKLSKKVESKEIFIKEATEVERESFGWAFFAAGALVGLFVPSIIKSLPKLFKWLRKLIFKI